ncbi:MAG: efflux RND transporter periplasmic adaptor subunit [Planctomycetes bacterium]|nr:efflux RND transporter periplasmic adaptor subunit [Planctomycetota bacterium]
MNLTNLVGTRRNACAIAAVLVLAGCAKQETPPMPPPPVTVAQPVQRTVPVYGEYVGQLDSPQTVELRARVEGYLKAIRFTEGADVKQGQLLFEIDPGQYEVALQHAKAQLLTAEAALAQARNVRDVEVDKANVAKAEAMFANAQQMARDARVAYEASAMPREQLNITETTMKEEAANAEAMRAKLAQSQADYITRVAQAEAQVATAKAAVADAELNLSYTKIYSPLDGRVGLSQVKIGALVGQNESTLLATVSLVNPVHAVFSISEREAFELRKLAGDEKLGQPREGKLAVSMILEDGALYPQEGKLNFVDRALDAGTGTLTLRAEFPNPGKFLRPGNFAKVRMLLTETPDALLVSERAVGQDQGGRFLLVVGAEDRVERRSIRLGSRAGDGLVVVKEGLKAGERVVVKGLQRARPGSVVAPSEEPMFAGAAPAVPQAGPETAHTAMRSESRE